MKKSKKILLLFEIIILVAATFISIGIYLNNLSKPKYIFDKTIDILKDKITNYIEVPNDLDLKDKYSIIGNIDFDLDSEYYKKTTNQEEIKKYNLIKNLNDLETNFKIQKNQTKNIGYIELNSNIKKQNILNTKYYINDSTKYYFIKDIVDDYINDGGCNYFENINTSNTEKDNIDYLYNFIFDSIKNNLKEDYFSIKEEKGKYLVTLKIDNNNLIDITNNILKDLKKDKKSKKILDNIDKKILKTKLDDDKAYLGKEENYKITIYTSKTLHRPVKYKIEKTTKKSIETYIYEGNEHKGTLTYLVNDSKKYAISLELKKDEIKAKIKNSSNKKIGEFKLEKTNYDTVINYTKNENNEKIDLIYSSKYTKIHKNENFTNKKNLSFKYVVDKETRLSGEININLDIKNKFSILTDISNAKLKTNLTEEEKEKIENLYIDIKERLEKYE